MSRKYRYFPGGSSFFCFLTVFFALSCASARPLRPAGTGPVENGTAERPAVTRADPSILKAAAVSAPSPEEALVEWRFFAPGVEYGKGKIRRPRLEYHALKIDLGQNGLSIVLNVPEAAPLGTV
ncbi:MAG: hypothetical protein LBK64_02445, partial [Spirochaetaceae bacterium]|nr:hypothetical protein [Spirochaetaceae bacterium]